MGRGELAGVAREIAANPEVVGQELPVGFGITGLLKPGDVGLGRHDDQHAEYERNEQPLEALFEIGGAAAEFEGIATGRTGEEEQQRHVPDGEKGDQKTQSGTEISVLDVVGFPEIKDPRRVKGYQRYHYQDAQPVDVITPVGFGHDESPNVSQREAGTDTLFKLPKSESVPVSR